MTQSTIILGLAAGYHYGDVRPFLQSLRATGHQGRCTLFVSPTTRDTERMAADGAEIVPFARPQEMEHVPYNAWRYFLYRDHLRGLQQQGQRFERILFCDVRDVVFQQDPFARHWPSGLHVFQEDLRMRVADCPHMCRWLRGHCGEAALQELADQHILCSGTTISDQETALPYLELMTQRLLPFTPGERMAGYDQGVHNLLVQRSGFAEVHFHDNTGPVLTLGYALEGAKLDQAGRVLNEAGQPAMLVHQYDRHPALFRMLRERYC